MDVNKCEIKEKNEWMDEWVDSSKWTYCIEKEWMIECVAQSESTEKEWMNEWIAQSEIIEKMGR
jgi:hypothetical protein